MGEKEIYEDIRELNKKIQQIPVLVEQMNTLVETIREMKKDMQDTNRLIINITLMENAIKNIQDEITKIKSDVAEKIKEMSLKLENEKIERQKMCEEQIEPLTDQQSEINGAVKMLKILGLVVSAIWTVVTFILPYLHKI